MGTRSSVSEAIANSANAPANTPGQPKWRRASAIISGPSPKPIITSRLKITEAGFSSSGRAIWPSVAMRAGATKDQPTPASAAASTSSGTRAPAAPRASASHSSSAASMNTACAAWISRPGASRSHSTPAYQPSSSGGPKHRPKPMPDSRSEPITSCA